MPESVQTQYPIHEQVRPFLTQIGQAEYDAALARWQADQFARQNAELQARVAELEAAEETAEEVAATIQQERVDRR